MELLIRTLRRDDDRSQFRSGDASLDTFFVQYAGQHQLKACASVTYVVEGEEQLAGYATVTAACVDIVDLLPEDRLRHPYPAPVLSLARLATTSGIVVAESGAGCLHMSSYWRPGWPTRLRHRQRRMRVVELDGHLLGRAATIAPDEGDH